MEGPEIKAVEADIDNGSYGKRTLRFETGRLSQQAEGAVAAYLDDDSMVRSTTTAGSSPKENYDFFPLTVDVEEKMYAAGKIPGSFFRRDGRQSTEAILACRIIERPLRPLFPHTLRNEVQVVETVLAVNPDDSSDMIALNAASASVDHDRRQQPEGELRFLPADRRRGRDDVRCGQDPGLVLPPRRPSEHGGHSRVPHHRPPAAPALPAHTAQ